MDKFLTSNNIQLCYQDLGDPLNPAILLIAGLGEQLGEWPSKFCDLFVDHGYRVIRFDNRDIGLSDKMSESYSLNDMADDAAGLLDGLSIKCAHVVGMSMGGMISQIFCAKYADRTSSLCLIMSTSGEPGLPKPEPQVKEVMYKKTDGSIGGFIDNWVEGKLLIDSPAYPTNEEALRARAKVNCERSYNPGGYMRHLNAIYSNGSRVPLLQTITCSTLIMHGTDDPLVPVECGVDLAEHINGSKLELIEGMGHNLPEALYARICDSIVKNIRIAEST